MRRLLPCLVCLWLLFPMTVRAEETVYRIEVENGAYLTDVCTDVDVGDQYITADNRLYEIVSIHGRTAVAEDKGAVDMPDISWMNADEAVPVAAMARRIALYCTHSDECYEPSDGTYTTRERGSIYQVAQALADALGERNIGAEVSDALHHPHDAGAYRRSRQTAVALIRDDLPDCLIDVHRDGIQDPASYAVTIGGKPVSKVRLLVGRGNQNAAVNKEFALTVKAVADRVYPGLIKDIYLGKGTFNQDLLPRALLFECGTYTLEKERVLASMPLMADVLSRTLYGGVVGSAGRLRSDANAAPGATAGVTMGEEDPIVAAEETGIGSGLLFLICIFAVGVVVVAVLSAGSLKGGASKLGRNLSEMTGGLIGKKPGENEDPDHS